MTKSIGRPKVPAEIRFWAKVGGSGDYTECWPWLGAVSSGKYGRYGLFAPNPERQMAAHRFAYLHMIGDIPDGYVLDHLCRNPNCVNPFHLDPVPQRINVLRGKSMQTHHELAQARTCCRRGHPRIPENITYQRNGATVRCKVCDRISAAKRKAA